MSLPPGTRLGPYEVIALLGAGGMGEVYRARDTRLKREVALKTLPASVAQDADRLTRFQREAEVLASLNHPHIAAVYGLEQSDGTTAIVMELVDGDTLAEKLATSPAPGLSMDDATDIARQIADALAAAHGRGIIHRDLKPANVKVRPDGTVKVLDFGLAKAIESGQSSGARRDLTESPTITSPAMMTGAGVILGTAAYMAPEQAKGRPVDQRADIWAFGCVLYEMLSRRRPFEGEDVSDTLAFVLTKEPAWDALPPATPAAIRRLLRRCLQKDPAKRLADIRDARLELDDSASDLTEPRPASRRASASWVSVAAAAIVAGLIGAAGSRLLPKAPVIERPLTHVSIGVEPAAQIAPSSFATQIRPSRTSLTLSPDGRTLVFSGARGSTIQLFRRSLDEPVATPLAGTEGAINPEFSPGVGQFAVANDGTFAYVTGGVMPERVLQPLFVDRHGSETLVKEPPGPIYNIRLSPDGRWLAFARSRPGASNRDIWVHDLERSATTRETLSNPFRGPLWSADGRSLFFGAMNREGLFWTVA